ncbi:hypothetical protein TRFO_08045 [Tritrichomonas foetus]|uniref:Uncharacterized protein n=1 Tax=Tritrichomonas foetus TaxID=1144522 RepID=A0A1J4JLZ2_9EUKA|nr:hypothetical protein TRFO_08045 [Tritrichomonas foetus]|eukprot:OHT00091.1 hypothetical protein TRFO_08045 [Tritrichomonas foetus]
MSVDSNDPEILQKEIARLKEEVQLRRKECEIVNEIIQERIILKSEFANIQSECLKYQEEAKKVEKEYIHQIEKLNATNIELSKKWEEDKKKWEKDKKQYQERNEAQQETILKLEKEKSAMESKIKKRKKENKIKSMNYEKQIKELKNKISDFEKEKVSPDQYQLLIDENKRLKFEILSLKHDQQMIMKQNLENVPQQVDESEDLNEMNKEKTKAEKNAKNESKPKIVKISENPQLFDEEFTIKRLEADARLINYYNLREERLKIIEGALKKNDIQSKKDFIYLQLQESLLIKDYKKKIYLQNQIISKYRSEIKKYRKQFNLSKKQKDD